MTTLEEHLLVTASRRSIYASIEARQTGRSVAEIRRAIQRLRRQGLLVRDAGSNKRPFFGAIDAGYRATQGDNQ